MLPIVLVAPHASSYVPDVIRERLALSDYEIWKCGDPFTDHLDEFTCASHKHVSEVNRLVCDMNRSPNLDNAFRDNDFYGRKIFKEGGEFTNTEKEDFLEKYWYPFHEDIVQSVVDLDEAGNEVILLVDYHNTAGDHPITEDGDYMPSMVLSNLGAEDTGETEPDYLTVSLPQRYIENLRDNVSELLNLSVEINKVYRGGYNLYWYTNLKEILGINAKVYSVQIEYNLDYVFNPITQSFNEEALSIMQRLINESLETLFESIAEKTKAKEAQVVVV